MTTLLVIALVAGLIGVALTFKPALGFTDSEDYDYKEYRDD